MTRRIGFNVGAVFLFRLIALLCLVVSAALPMQASVTHTVKFGQGPVVMVWQDGEPVGRGEAVTLEGEASPAPRADWVGGGLLEPVSYTGFDEDTALVEQLSIASNAPVRLRLEGSALSGTVKLRLLEIGSEAQYNGPQLIELDLSASADRELLLIPQKTAKSAGSVAAQTLTFELERTGAASGLSMVIETVNYG